MSFPGAPNPAESPRPTPPATDTEGRPESILYCLCPRLLLVCVWGGGGYVWVCARAHASTHIHVFIFGCARKYLHGETFLGFYCCLSFILGFWRCDVTGLKPVMEPPPPNRGSTCFCLPPAPCWDHRCHHTQLFSHKLESWFILWW